MWFSRVNFINSILDVSLLDEEKRESATLNLTGSKEDDIEESGEENEDSKEDNDDGN